MFDIVQVWIVSECWIMNGEYDNELRVFKEEKDAVNLFKEKVEKAKKDMEYISCSEEATDNFIDVKTYSIYEEGYFDSCHICIRVQKKEVEDWSGING